MPFLEMYMIQKIRHWLIRMKEGRLQEMRTQLGWVYRYARPHIFMIILYTLLGLSGTVVSLISSLVSRSGRHDYRT